jgi:type IV pilus assembly protein PilX
MTYAIMALRAGMDNQKPTRGHQQRGAALIVTLLMMLVVVMLSMSGIQVAWQGEKGARGDRDRYVAFQAAEAALMDAQKDIETSFRQTLFAQGGGEGFSDACDSKGVELYLGLCKPADPQGVPVWGEIDFLDAEKSRSVPYGRFTGQQFQAGAGLVPAMPPRYIIEQLSHVETESAPATVFYRITALGFGMRGSTQVMLQVFYRPDERENIVSSVPKGRFGWREISNWREARHARDKT